MNWIYRSVVQVLVSWGIRRCVEMSVRSFARWLWIKCTVYLLNMRHSALRLFIWPSPRCVARDAMSRLKFVNLCIARACQRLVLTCLLVWESCHCLAQVTSWNLRILLVFVLGWVALSATVERLFVMDVRLEWCSTSVCDFPSGACFCVWARLIDRQLTEQTEKIWITCESMTVWSRVFRWLSYVSLEVIALSIGGFCRNDKGGEADNAWQSSMTLHLTCDEAASNWCVWWPPDMYFVSCESEAKDPYT